MPKRTSPELPWIGFLLLMLGIVFLPLKAVWAPAYLYWILLAGPLVLVPWGVNLLTKGWPAHRAAFRPLLPFAGLLLTGAFCWPPGAVATVLAALWLVVVTGLVVWAVRHYQQLPLAALLSFLLLMVAAAWALADRLGWQPLGFDPLIVLLTAVHFHYAGFALAVLVAMLPESRWQAGLSWGLLLGVGGVAVGITSTQLDGPAAVEIAAVTLMVVIGWGVALLQFTVAVRTQNLPSRLLLLLGSVALCVGLLLALLYGWRFVHQWAWLTMPWMYATHGLLNSVGFAFLSFLGWSLKSEE